MRCRASDLRKTENFLLVVHISSKKEAALVKNKIIEARLQSMKKAAHGITSKKELKYWTSYSFREGAYILLRKSDNDGPFIKILLR